MVFPAVPASAIPPFVICGPVCTGSYDIETVRLPRCDFWNGGDDAAEGLPCGEGAAVPEICEQVIG